MNIKKLYKYRPLSGLLFKELKYNELYFSSYHELNDPLDLSARMNFMPSNREQLEYLIYFLIKRSIVFSLMNESKIEKKYIQKLAKLAKDEETKSKICDYLYDCLKKLNQEFIPQDIIEKKIKEVSKVFKVEFRLSYFSDEIRRITKVFFESSYISCFSETCTDFLMWSHYASKHTGICLEFSLKYQNLFPYIFFGERKIDHKRFMEKKFQEWEINGGSYWDKISKVKYQKSAPIISFYDFSAVFENEGNCDLMGLSKSRWHGYAHELERVFSVKTLPWKYEKEWRAIEINFGKLEEPEERIRHYPIEAVTGIYFGVRTPNDIKDRIYKILNSKKENIDYFNCQLSNNRDLEFKKWEYCEE